MIFNWIVFLPKDSSCIKTTERQLKAFRILKSKSICGNSSPFLTSGIEIASSNGKRSQFDSEIFQFLDKFSKIFIYQSWNQSPVIAINKIFSSFIIRNKFHVSTHDAILKIAENSTIKRQVKEKSFKIEIIYY